MGIASRSSDIRMPQDCSDSIKVHSSLNEEACCGVSEIVETCATTGPLNGMGKGICVYPKRESPQSKANVMHNRDRSGLSILRSLQVDEVALDVDRPELRKFATA
jgi:hypothetical protein